MLVYIDDSGDPGFKLEKNSSSHFVIAMVLFSDALEAEKTAVAIKEFRRKLGFDDSVEFKFCKSREDIKLGFLETVAPFGFRVRALVVNKRLIRSDELRRNKESFYAYFIKSALKYHGGEIADAKIRIDGSGDRTFRREFVSYLRRELNQAGVGGVIQDVKFVDSRENVLIQLADMVAGAIHRRYSKEEPQFRDIVAVKITDEWQFQ